ncbi:iron-containing alcohol dehydrogenase [Nonomuraea lactucae]|uniref:iron-containing alcohol dehydrogenase n=1 Tax=Nonomuraea lactucae TaxID=2249762 RepID=UPI0013B43735|nr:iron-containing alcohol dehydrogenase [Nonomuraea lactucae]
MTPVRRCLVAAAALPVLAGCGGTDPGPTPAQAGETLRSHINQLMKDTGLPNVAVTDPGGRDLDCGENGTKRTYGVRSTFRGEDAGLIDEMTGRLTQRWGYKVDAVFAPESYRTVLKLVPSRTTVTLDMPTKHEITVAGETDCVQSQP